MRQRDERGRGVPRVYRGVPARVRQDRRLSCRDKRHRPLDRPSDHAAMSRSMFVDIEILIRASERHGHCVTVCGQYIETQTDHPQRHTPTLRPSLQQLYCCCLQTLHHREYVAIRNPAVADIPRDDCVL